MDKFGIGSAIAGAVSIYFRSARGTGRTTTLVEGAKDGDRIIFSNVREANRVQRLCKEIGAEVQCIVVDPKSPQSIFERGTSQGRTILDHSWVEQYYLDAIKRAQEDIDYFERESSGYGMAHVETRLCYAESAKWLR